MGRENGPVFGPEFWLLPVVLAGAALSCWLSGGGDEGSRQAQLVAQATAQAAKSAPPPDSAPRPIPETDNLASFESGYLSYLQLPNGLWVICGRINSNRYHPKTYNHLWPNNLTPSEVMEDLAPYGAGPPYFFVITSGDEIIEYYEFSTLYVEKSRKLANRWKNCVLPYPSTYPTPSQPALSP